MSEELLKLAIGHIDSSIRRTITIARTMGKESEEILPAVKPYLESQQKVLTDNQLTKEQVGLELITSEEDYLDYWVRLTTRDVP